MNSFVYTIRNFFVFILLTVVTSKSLKLYVLWYLDECGFVVDAVV